MERRKLHTMKRGELNRLIEVLRKRGYEVKGPTVRDDTIVYDDVRSIDDLPLGWTDAQSPGRYRLTRTDYDTCFDFTVGPHSWKKYLFPPKLQMFAVTHEGQPVGGFRVDAVEQRPPRYAFLGVRACELAAIAVQDRVLIAEISDPYYRQAREQAFIVAVNCIRPGDTCFCASMNAGPECLRDFDLSLTELDDGFALEVGSEAGASVLPELSTREATPTERRLLNLMLERARDRMGRQMDTRGLPELLKENLESPRWESIATRCLSCANCTMVCPTCFCYSVHEHTDLSGDHAERWRLWGSCYTLEFSYMGGHNLRTSASSRYRQWMMHKLSYWHEQFGTSGCVGCGRCIAWCPVGIDITEEAAAFRRDAMASEHRADESTAPQSSFAAVHPHDGPERIRPHPKGAKT